MSKFDHSFGAGYSFHGPLIIPSAICSCIGEGLWASGQAREAGITVFAMEKALAHDHVVQPCLAYLLFFNTFEDPTAMPADEFPFALYAARYWLSYACSAGHSNEALNLSPKLLGRESTAFKFCLQLHDPNKPWDD